MRQIPQIPGYRIERILGQGGMATVYLGVQEKLEREVAIKILEPEMFKDLQYLQRFLNEARTASQLNHPNIITIHDVGQVDNHCFIVMERLHESLVERVKFKPDCRLTPLEAFKIIRQVAVALEFAHREGVIHRDIKPDNILFRKDGAPVLADFGIARALDSSARLTTTGMIIGTPHYMSPEQCKGEPIDGLSDIYSLGIVLYEILTGDVPYRADSAAGVLLKHVQAPVPMLPLELSRYQTIITRVMAKDKRERVQNAAELIRLLDTFGPDSRLDTIKGTKGEAWFFDKSSPPDALPGDPRVITSPTPSPGRDVHDVRDVRDVPAAASAAAAQVHDTYELQSHHPLKRTKGPLIVTLIAIPFILTAIYFLFFQEQPRHTSSPTSTAAAARKDQPAAKQTGAAGDTGKPTTGAIDESYKRYFILAEEYLKNNEYEKTLENLAKARGVKDTPEIKALEDRVKQLADLSKEKEYTKYFNLARDAYGDKNYEQARANLQLARQYKTTEELDKLAQDLDGAEKKKADAAEKTRKEAEQQKKIRQQDDQAFQRAKGMNTVYSYEKYLKDYPQGLHAEEAGKKYDQLKEAITLEERIKDDTAFELAAKANTFTAYEDYIDKNPTGRHIQEANTRVLQLKEKILKETRVKLNVREIKFFQFGPKAPPVEQRVYGTRFSRQEARYIYTEISYDNKLYGVVESKSEITILYSGAAFAQELKGSIIPEKESRTGLYWQGMGWSEPEKWLPGTYTITIYLEGQKVGQSRFEVY